MEIRDRVHSSNDAPAVAASLMYGMILQPLQSAFGDFGSLITAELEAIPLHNPNDVLCAQFKRIFDQQAVRHG